MLEKCFRSSNENLDSQSRRTDNHLRQSISRFTKKLLSHVTYCVSPRDESQSHEQDSMSRASGSDDREKTFKYGEPSDKLLDIARGAASKEWVHPDKAAEYLAETIKKALQEGKKIGLMFDIDYTLLDPRKVKFGTKEWQIPQKWLDGARKLQQHGIKVAINTGRNALEIDQAFENAGAEDLKNSLYLFGEYSNVYKKPGEDWKLIDPEAQAYVKPVEEIRNKIKDKIKENKILTNLGITPDNAILNQMLKVTAPRWLIRVIFKENKNKIFEESKVFGELKSIAEEVVREYEEVVGKYPKFIVKCSEQKGLEVRPEGVKEAHKGNGTETFVKENELSMIRVFGDDKPDVAMASKAHLLVEANKFINDNKSLVQKDSIRSAFIQDLEKRYELKLTDDEKAMITKTKNDFIKEFHEKLFSSTPGTQLEDYALIAVRHVSDMKIGKKLQDIYREEQDQNAVYDAATVTAGGTKELLDLLEKVVNELDTHTAVL